jgi:8-oxo-dGTP diphosphatase
MSNFQSPQSHIHVIARGFLVRGDKIILCRAKDSDYFFLPGGHIEDGESARTALLRELYEEIGPADYKITSFMGVVENIFPLEESILQQEMNIVFAVDVPIEMEITTKENHIEFVGVPKESLAEYRILPTSLKDALLDWAQLKNPFFKES